MKQVATVELSRQTADEEGLAEEAGGGTDPGQARTTLPDEVPLAPKHISEVALSSMAPQHLSGLAAAP